MSKHNKTKAEQLGMSYGKARNILNKAIMFDLIQQLDLDTCYQCGNKIESINEMSVEHTVPWLNSDNPSELFFDLDNIAFSHLSCNSKASRPTTFHKNVKLGKSGFKGVRINNDKSKNKNKYKVVIIVEGKGKHVSYCNDPIEGAIAYDECAIELWGEKAVTNKSLGLL